MYRQIKSCNQICLLLHAYLIKMFTHYPTEQGDPEERQLDFCLSVLHMLEIKNYEGENTKIQDALLISNRNIRHQVLNGYI